MISGSFDLVGLDDYDGYIFGNMGFEFIGIFLF